MWRVWVQVKPRGRWLILQAEGGEEYAFEYEEEAILFCFLQEMGPRYERWFRGSWFPRVSTKSDRMGEGRVEVAEIPSSHQRLKDTLVCLDMTTEAAHFHGSALDALRDDIRDVLHEVETMKRREKTCATMDMAEKVALVMAIQKIGRAVGLTDDNSPREIVDRVTWLSTNAKPAAAEGNGE